MNLQPLIYILLFVTGGIIVLFWQRRQFSKLITNFQQRLIEVIEGKKKDDNGNLTNKSLNEELIQILQQAQKAIEALKKNSEVTKPKNESALSAEQLKKSIDNLYIVNELGRKVTSSLNLHQTFQHLYATINSLMDAAILELYSFDSESKTWKLFSNYEYGSSLDRVQDPYYNQMALWSIDNNREVFLTDAERDYGRYVFNPLLLPDGKAAKSVMVFPISEKGKVSATLSVLSFQKHMYSEYHQEIIRLLLGYIAVAMNNSFTHDELNRTKLRAEESEKFKEKFLANMSHEIRTPINAVSGMTRLLLEKSPRPDQLRYLDGIHNASDSLLVIINEILDLSKIEAGKIELEKIDFSVTDVLKNVREIMLFKAEEKGIVLTITESTGIPKVLIGDPTRLSQILINLVGNALKFTEKGTVQLSVDVSSAATSGSGEQICSLTFSVQDTGIGMTPEQLEKLFTDYAQASSETSRKYGGTGLGLSISRQLVQLQKGTISVTSKPGEGSIFYFTIPYPVSKSIDLSRSQISLSEEMLKALKGINVLLVDDNEYNLLVARETLELKIDGIRVEEAHDGKSALELIKKNTYDIVLMDLVMPVMDGLEATRYVRKNLPAPKNTIKILALTASVIKSEIDNCMDAGMNGFIPKPFKTHELLGAIYKALNPDGSASREIQLTAPPKSTSATPLIDLTYLDEFTEGDLVRQKRYIDLFLSKVPQSVQSIRDAFNNDNKEGVRIGVHSIKPQLQSVGAIQVLELAEKIEQECRQTQSTENLTILIDKFSLQCNQAIEELQKR